MDTIHVMPLNDEGEHEGKENCTCTPTLVLSGTGYKILIHNSVDGREYCTVVKQKPEWSKTPFITT